MHVPEPSWETIKQEFASACSQSAQTARTQIVHELDQFLRRLRQYQSEGEWVMALLDGASHFVHQAAVLAIQDGAFHLRGQRNLNTPENFAFPARSAGAFAAALDSKDPVIALRTPAEVTEPLSAAEPGARAHLVPILNGIRVVAVLFAGGSEPVDVNALELIASMASMVLERQSNTALHAQIAALAPKPKLREMVASALPAWADLIEQQQALHIRARRFSRVTIAEIQLARPEACRAGREQRNLYLFIKKELDKARETYRKQFMTIPSIVDYLHLALVRTAADGDELTLGAEYPGQLV